MFDDIKELSFYYISNSKMNLEEARRLYVEVVEDFLNRINNNKEIRSYLHDYPFTIKNLDLMIHFSEDTNDENSLMVLFNTKKN